MHQPDARTTIDFPNIMQQCSFEEIGVAIASPNESLVNGQQMRSIGDTQDGHKLEFSGAQQLTQLGIDPLRLFRCEIAQPLEDSSSGSPGNVARSLGHRRHTGFRFQADWCRRR
jgi:hypothetical protein